MPAITPHTPIDHHMRDWRHDLHRHPETAYEETRTAAKIAALLHDFGLDEIHTGLAQTGVVGVLHSPNYDFNDDILATGASLWIALAQAQT